MDEIKKTQDEMRKRGKEVTDLKQSLEFTENVLEEKGKKLDEKHVNLENQCNELCNNSLESEFFYKKLVDLEERSGKKDLRIDGIAEKPNENWERFEEQLQNVFKEKLGLDNVQIEHVHRVRNKRNKDKRTKPRTIVCKILSYKQKKEVLKNPNKLKGTDIFLNEDFCHETIQQRKELWEEVKRLCSKGQIAYLNYRSIVVKGKRDQGE